MLRTRSSLTNPTLTDSGSRTAIRPNLMEPNRTLTPGISCVVTNALIRQILRPNHCGPHRGLSSTIDTSGRQRQPPSSLPATGSTAPQVMGGAVDLHEHLVEVPF